MIVLNNFTDISVLVVTNNKLGTVGTIGKFTIKWKQKQKQN